MLSLYPFDNSVGVGAFVIGLSQISSFFSEILASSQDLLWEERSRHSVMYTLRDVAMISDYESKYLPEIYTYHLVVREHFEGLVKWALSPAPWRYVSNVYPSPTIRGMLLRTDMVLCEKPLRKIRVIVRGNSDGHSETVRAGPNQKYKYLT